MSRWPVLSRNWRDHDRPRYWAWQGEFTRRRFCADLWGDLAIWQGAKVVYGRNGYTMATPRQIRDLCAIDAAEKRIDRWLK